MKLIKFLGTILTTLFLEAADAGMLFEPHVGYDLTRVVKNSNAAPTTDNGFKTNAASFGARIGVMFGKMFWLAGDVDYTSGKNAYNNTSVNPTNFNYNRTDGYALVGVDLPFLARVWAGYGFSSKMTLQTTGGDTVVTGTSMKGGVGFKILPKISLNIEYIVRSMTDEKIGTAASTKISSTYSMYKDVGALASISVPIGF